MKLSRMLTLVVSVFVVGALALPATAGVETGSIAITSGAATVGNSIGGGPIPQSGECVPTGKGLNYPLAHISNKNKAKTTPFQVNKEVYYRLQMPAPGGQPVQVVITDTNDVPNSGAFAGTMNVCGIVGPGPSGIGAACGSSSGHNGRGKLDVTNAVTGQRRIFDLQKVTWPPTASGTLPVFGYITRVNLAKTRKFSAKGTFEGAVNAIPDPGKLPNNSCARAKATAKDGGANFFVVNGTAAAEALGKPAGGKDVEPKLRKET